nr:PIG-L family deacetylase [uncultured Bacteroides sp.]
MKYLIVVAHPDDEVLGAGASIRKWTQNGDIVDICIMCTEAKARAFRPEDNELDEDLNSSSDFLGIHRKYEGIFPNIEMNTVPHIKLVQFIENAIIKSEPDVIITHHASDTNNDHLQTSMACQEAIRLFQRRPEVKSILEFWFMEVGSATDWNLNTTFNAFRPNIYVEVGEDGVDAKIKALSMYRGVMRPYPHPRSNEAMKGLAAWRGSQAGCMYAEAFETGIRRI